MSNKRNDAQPVTPLAQRPAPALSANLTELEPQYVDDDLRQESATSPLATVLRYKWTAAIVSALAATVLVAGVWVFIAPQYSATAKLEVSPVIPQLVEGHGDMVPLYESYRSSQVDHITGPEVIDAVLDRPDVRNTAFYRDEPATAPERLLRRVVSIRLDPPRDRLLKALEAVAPRGKQHIYVTLNATRPGEARLIVDAVVDEYVKFSNRRESDQELDRMSKLRNEIRTREGDLSRIQASAAEHRARLKSAAPEALLEQRLLRLDALIARMAELEREAELAAAPAATGAVPATQPAPDDQLEADAEWRRLNADVAAARAAVEQAPQQYGDLHPTMDRLRKAVEFAERRLQERTKTLVGAGVGASDANARLLREIELLKKAVHTEQEAYEAAFKDGEVLRNLDAEATELAATLQRLRSELERIEMNRQVAGTIRRWAAYEPARPTDDRRIKFSGAAIAAGLALGLGVAFLRGRFGAQVARAEEVLPASTPVLGRLPLSRTAGPTVYLNDPTAAESLRLLRTALMESLERSGGKVIQITSAEPGCGKSTLAVELSRSLALLNKRVLLVDADVRCSGSAGGSAANHGHGLMTLLAAPQSDAGAEQDREIPTLFTLPAGACQHIREIELFANGRFRALVSRWRGEFDFVILDTPPLLANADAAILSRHVDGTLLLVREWSCRRRAVAAALDALNAAGGRVLGTVVIAPRSDSRTVWLADYPYPSYYRRRYDEPAAAADDARSFSHN